jgi:hypothetical protein
MQASSGEPSSLSRTLARIIEGLEGRDAPTAEPAKKAGYQTHLSRLPWADDNRALDKTRIYKYLIDNPSGAPISRLCKALFPEEPTDGPISERSYASKDYSFTKRFLESAEIGALDRSSELLRVEPTLEAFHLIHPKQNSNQNHESPENHRDSAHTVETEALGLTHKQYAEKFIGQLDRVDTPDQARALAKPYLKYLDSINDKQLIMEDQHHPGENYLLMPYHTRFNNEKRADDQWRRYHNAWDRALDEYENGLHLTLTTDPKRFDSIAEMTNHIFTAWGDLLEALNARSARDDRLDFVRALEWTGDGKPHLHVVVFGVRYIEHSWLKHYWSTKAGDGGHAENVWIERLTKRGNQFIHASTRAGEERTVKAKAYLGEYLSRTFEEIDESVTHQFETLEELGDDLDVEDCAIWKMALYWATGRQFWDCSHGLKEPNPDRLEDVSGLGAAKLDALADAGIRTLADVRLATRDDLEAIDGLGDALIDRLLAVAGKPSDFDLGRWAFKGAAEYGSIPMHVTSNASVVGVS